MRHVRQHEDIHVPNNSHKCPIYVSYISRIWHIHGPCMAHSNSQCMAPCSRTQYMYATCTSTYILSYMEHAWELLGTCISSSTWHISSPAMFHMSCINGTYGTCMQDLRNIYVSFFTGPSFGTASGSCIPLVRSVFRRKPLRCFKAKQLACAVTYRVQNLSRRILLNTCLVLERNLDSLRSSQPDHWTRSTATYLIRLKSSARYKRHS